MREVAAEEIVAQRILWSMAFILILLVASRNMGSLIKTLRTPRLLFPLIGSAVLIAGNWLIYIWAVNDDHVIAASLGYFLNPLVNVALGVLLLKEKLRRSQAIAIAIAAVGVAIMAGAAITTLWISVLLALSFAFYGLIRKLTPVTPMAGLGVETLVLTPPACAYIFWLSSQHGVNFGDDPKITGLLMATGVISTVPLLLFAMAARRLRMATLGLLQYVAPTLLFLCGVVLYDEKLNQGQMLSFALIWFGLILFATDSIVSARRNRLSPA